jgi:hypothetical protein
MTDATHVHVERHSSDCDGSYITSYTREGDLWSIPTHTFLELTLNGAGYFNLEPIDSDEGYRLTAGAPTDEGGWEIVVTECADDCDYDRDDHLHRDLRAEEAGY